MVNFFNLLPLLLAAGAIGYAPSRWRMPLLLIASLSGLFWLQGNWIVSLATLLLVYGAWWIASVERQVEQKWRWLILAGVGLGLLLTVPQTSPDKSIAIGILLILLMWVGKDYLASVSRSSAVALWLALMIGLLVVAKTSSTLQWVGLSYLIFRLIALLIDAQAGRLPSFSLPEMLIFAIFSPALPAGPIDRAQHFIPQIQAAPRLDNPRLLAAGQRIIDGLFRKFVLADTLALITLSPQLAQDVHSPAGAWLIAYVYAFHIFLDFSGYSSLAIGLGMLAGIDLPENFNRPYFQPNLSLFWQNWHMTLTGWFRAYWFLPLSRALLRRRLPVSEYLIAQGSTMLLIALWHGVAGHFILWGLWHTAGLYIYHVSARWSRSWYLSLSPLPQQLIRLAGIGLTFHYVVVGWVFFALDNPLPFLAKLVGL